MQTRLHYLQFVLPIIIKLKPKKGSQLKAHDLNKALLTILINYKGVVQLTLKKKQFYDKTFIDVIKLSRARYKWVAKCYITYEKNFI